MKRHCTVVLSATLIFSHFFMFSYLFAVQTEDRSSILPLPSSENNIMLSSSEADSNLTFVDGLFFGLAHDIDVQGNYCYVGAGSSLMIFDISNPADPRLIGSFFTVHDIYRIVVSGKYVYVLSPNVPPIFFIIDVADPRNPRQVGVYRFDDISRFLYHWNFFISGNYAYFPFESERLRILDISDKSNPIEIEVSISSASIKKVIAVNDYLYVLEDRRGLVIFDQPEPGNFTEVGYYPILDNLVDLSLSGNFAYVSTYISFIDSTELYIIDISDPTNPQKVGCYSTDAEDGYGIRNIRSLQNHLYFVNKRGELFILDVSDPLNPQEVPHLFTERVGHFLISNNFIFATDGKGFLIVDISDLSMPKVEAYYDGGQVLGMITSGDYLYVAYGEKGIRILDISNPSKPEEVGFWEGDSISGFDVGFNFQHLRLWGDFLYAADTRGGIIYLFDISDPTHPRKRVSYELGEKQHGFTFDVQGEYIYVSMPYYWDPALNEGYFLFRVIDFSNPDAPVGIARLEIEGIQQGDIRVFDDHAYVGTQDNGLLIIDVSDPTNPVQVGNYNGGAYVRLEFLDGNRAYISVDEEKLIILDITNPVNPMKVGEFSFAAFSPRKILGGIYVLDNRIYLRLWRIFHTPYKYFDRVMVLDISNPADIKKTAHFGIGGINLEGTPTQAICGVGDYIYVANFYYGLYILKFTPTNDVEENLTDFIVPQKFSLDQNYPNPFNPMTTISYRLPKTAVVTLRIYNLLGQQVRTLVDEVEKPGYYTAQWDGRDEQGMDLPSGVYFYRLRVDRDKFVETKKMLLLR